MYETPLDELKPKLEALGLSVDTDFVSDENDAEVSLGDKHICYLHFNEVEDGWDVTDFGPFFTNVDETVERVEAELAEKKTTLSFRVTLEFSENAPEPTVKASKCLATLIAQSITELVPSKSKVQAVVVDGLRRKPRARKVSR